MSIIIMHYKIRLDNFAEKVKMSRSTIIKLALIEYLQIGYMPQNRNNNGQSSDENTNTPKTYSKQLLFSHIRK